MTTPTSKSELKRQNIMRGRPMMEGITQSCGCVFCDLGLAPTKNNVGARVHAVKNRLVPCTKDEGK